MHKVVLKNIIVFLSAAYFLMAGAGYNVVKYCCDTCAYAGIEQVATTSCGSIHEHQHDHEKPSSCCDHNEDFTCTDATHDSAGCHLLRIKVDVPSIQSVTCSLKESIPVFQLLYANFQSVLPLNAVFANSHSAPPIFYLYTSGRQILALHAVLLI